MNSVNIYDFTLISFHSTDYTVSILEINRNKLNGMEEEVNDEEEEKRARIIKWHSEMQYFIIRRA